MKGTGNPRTNHWRTLTLALAVLLFAWALAACGGGGGGGGGAGGGGGGGTLPTVTSDDSVMKLDGVATAPPLRIDPEQPASGDTVTVSLANADATAVTVDVEGTGCGALTDTAGGDSVTLVGVVGEHGTCSITAVFSLSGGGTESVAGYFAIAETDPDLPPVAVAGGVYRAAALPAASPSADRPSVTDIAGPGTVINGSSPEYTVNYNSPTGETVVAALVSIPGYDGHFRLPVNTSGGSITFNLDVDDDAFVPAAPRRGQRASMRSALLEANFDVEVMLEDLLGLVSDPFTLSLLGQEVGTGDVKVSISWDTPTDVDLHVTEPGGEEIYYSHETSAAGGQLDLDSNAGCSIDGVNNENIFWPNGQSPGGDYQVRVHMWSACNQSGASGTLTIVYCGDDSPLSIPFSLGTSGDYTYSFNSTCTTQATVAGTVKYEDFAVTNAGLAAAGTMLPLRHAKVQVLRASDNAVLVEGSVDAAGKYNLSFENDGTAGYYVKVLLSQDSSTLKQDVKDLAGNLYTFRMPATGSIDESVTPDKTDLDFAIKKADGAGACNIFDTGATFSDYARLHGGKTPSKLTFRWTAGQKPEGQETSFFSGSTSEIYVLGMATDPDEYDDVILGHEYGHFVLHDYSKDDSPGGSHSSNSYSNPTLAWSEGWASFFACASLGRSSYADTNATGMGVYYSLETLPASKPLGNEGNVQNGKLSEAIVAAALLDLFDTSNETNDTLKEKSTAIWTVVTTYLKSGNAKFSDRGVANRDLVDFLDGWFCLGNGDKGEDDTKGMRGNVKGLHRLSYDFADVASCK